MSLFLRPNWLCPMQEQIWSNKKSGGVQLYDIEYRYLETYECYTLFIFTSTADFLYFFYVQLRELHIYIYILVRTLVSWENCRKRCRLEQQRVTTVFLDFMSQGTLAVCLLPGEKFSLIKSLHCAFLFAETLRELAVQWALLYES